MPRHVTAPKSLPPSIQQFVQQQATAPISEMCREDSPSPYGSWWYRAVACILLSGRVGAKMYGDPNMTDVNRLGKEANFNQYLVERIARFLVAAKVIQANRRGEYSAGVNHGAFWKHECKQLQAITRHAVLELIQKPVGYLPQRATKVQQAHLVEFLILFFNSFHGLALREEGIGKVLRAFSQLPEADLIQAARGAGLGKEDVDPSAWTFWLAEKGQDALLSALYSAEWAWGHEDKKKVAWVFPSPIGLGMLGIGPMPPAPPLAKDLKATSNLAIFAGAGLDFDLLVPLFRYCKIKRIDQVYEFQVDRRRLQEAPAGVSPGEELRAVLSDVQPLPDTLADALQAKSKLGGKIGVRWCSALVKPETPEMLSAIREHSQLKGYLEPGAWAGYLLIKPGSNPNTFVRRCQALGFEVKPL